VSGPLQSAKSELSKLHRKLFTSTLLLSEPENVNVIELDLVLLPLDKVFLLLSTTELIDVVGGIVSIVQAKDAGDASRFATIFSSYFQCMIHPKIVNCLDWYVVNDAPSTEHW
jgi:hypothetical protein